MVRNSADQYAVDPIAEAVELIRIAARLQFAEHESELSDERLLTLFREAAAESANTAVPTDPAQWFLEWQPNVHASLFVGIWRYVESFADVRGVDAVTQAYRIYLSHLQATSVDPILTVTRAWTLVRYLDVLLTTARCCQCASPCIRSVQSPIDETLCGFCRSSRYDRA